ncbi:MAG: glycosyltransferase [Phycisphaerales bacterium]
MDAQHTTFLFAGGGTGGHIFPALAIAEALQESAPGCGCVFLVSERALDAEILRKQSVGGRPARFERVPARPFGVTPRVLYQFVSNWGLSVRVSRGHVREARGGGACVVVAMGGFVAAPVAQAARVEGVPVLLVNLDAVPGRANRWVARRAARVLTSAVVAGGAGGGAAGGGEVIPPIVRAGAVSAKGRGECRESLGLDGAKPTLLVTGGSQGASSINDFLSAYAGGAGASALAGWQVIHQTGPGRGEGAVREAYARAGVGAVVAPFFDRMGECWGAAELAVCRSGAGNVGEVWAGRVPSIFLPYPYHRDQHQKYNAEALVRAGGAVVCEDRIDAGANLAGAGACLTELLQNAGKRGAMRSALEALGPADGAGRVARALVSLV